MNHRKQKQQKNLNKSKPQKINSYSNDPLDSICPFCGRKQKPCSYVNSLSRAWSRSACKKKNEL